MSRRRRKIGWQWKNWLAVLATDSLFLGGFMVAIGSLGRSDYETIAAPVAAVVTPLSTVILLAGIGLIMMAIGALMVRRW